MKTDNELIAEFMGIAKTNGRYLIEDFPHIHASMYCGAESLDFHRSWDWLMRVVEKIRNINELYQGDQFAYKVISLPISTPIEEVYREVVNCIKCLTKNQTA